MEVRRKYRVNPVPVVGPSNPEDQGDLSALITEVGDGSGRVYSMLIMPGMPIEEDFVAAFGIVLYRGISNDYFQRTVAPLAEAIDTEGLEAMARFGFVLKKEDPTS